MAPSPGLSDWSTMPLAVSCRGSGGPPPVRSWSRTFRRRGGGAGGREVDRVVVRAGPVATTLERGQGRPAAVDDVADAIDGQRGGGAQIEYTAGGDGKLVEDMEAVGLLVARVGQSGSHD